MSIEVIFLGTGTSQGVPMIGCHCDVCNSIDPRDQRLRSSVLVRTKGVTMVIDTSMDFRVQMLREKVGHLDAVLYTHEHRDHTGGMDDLRAYNYHMNRAVDIYCTKQVSQMLNRTFDYAFAPEPYPGVPQLKLHIIGRKTFSVNRVEVVPVFGKHFVIEVTGFRIGDFAYLTDFNAIEPLELDKLKGVKTLVINALRRKPHISHFTLDQALQIIEQVNPTEAYLTHLSHQMGLYVDVEAELPENVHVAYDGLRLEII